MSRFNKDPEAVLDYEFDLSPVAAQGVVPYLTDGEIIESASVYISKVAPVEDPVTLEVDSTSHTDTVIKTWLSGGTVGTSYTVTALFTTSGGRTDERSIIVKIKER